MVRGGWGTSLTRLRSQAGPVLYTVYMEPLAVLQSKTKEDVSTGVWLELENEEFGWWLQSLSGAVGAANAYGSATEMAPLERGHYYFQNNLENFAAVYTHYKITLWNSGVIIRSVEMPNPVPPVGLLITVPVAKGVAPSQ